VSLPGINPVAYFSPRQQPEGFRKYFARLLSTRAERIKITTITALNFATNIKQFGKAVVGRAQKRAREARKFNVWCDFSGYLSIYPVIYSNRGFSAINSMQRILCTMRLVFVIFQTGSVLIILTRLLKRWENYIALRIFQL
jgi:hypothetical protein